MSKLVNPFPRHIPALDGARGIAIIGVVLLHFFEVNTVTRFEGVLKSISHHGMWGIDLFFILSGFLITGILVETKEKEGYFKSFFMRRTLRIFPIYYILLAVIYFIAPNIAFFEGDAMDQILKAEPWAWTYTMNVYQSIENRWVPYIGHFWSLAVEEHFYLFWPILVYFVPNKHLVKLCISMILFSFGFRILTAYLDEPSIVRYIFTFSRFDALCLGAYMAVKVRLSDSNEDAISWLKKFTVFSAVVGFLTVFIINYYQTPLDAYAAYLEAPRYLGYGLFIAAFLSVGLLSKEGGVVRKFFEWNFFKVYWKV